MVATAPSVPSSPAGPPAQGRSASRSAWDRRGAIEVLPENDVSRRLEHRHLDRPGATTCAGRHRPHRRDSHRGRPRFSGQTRGGRYSWARYYHPQLQHFVSEDPFGFLAGDPNLYGYVGNDPLNYIDPLGTTKGGEQNLFRGSDDPLLRGISKQMTKEQARERARIIEEAIKNEAMSKARRDTLRGAAKVLKRFFKFGGAIIFIISELADPAEAGGGPGDTIDSVPIPDPLPKLLPEPASQIGCRKC